MAGDWIKVRHSLRSDPAVLKLRRLLEMDDLDLVVGKLTRFWIWASEQTSTGMLDGTDAQDIDLLVERKGFAQGLIEVEWLKRTRHGLQIPNYERHMSSSAKARAGEAVRKAQSRRRLAGNAADSERPDERPDVRPDKSVTRAAAKSKKDKTLENSSIELPPSRQSSSFSSHRAPVAAATRSSTEVVELLLQLRYKQEPVFNLTEALEVAADPRFMPDHIAYAQQRLAKYKKHVDSPPALARWLMSQKPAKWNAAGRLQELRQMAAIFRSTSGSRGTADFDPRVNPDAGRRYEPCDSTTSAHRDGVAGDDPLEV